MLWMSGFMWITGMPRMLGKDDGCQGCWVCHGYYVMVWMGIDAMDVRDIVNACDA